MKFAQPLLILVRSTILGALLHTADGFCVSTTRMPFLTKMRRTSCCVANTQLTDVTWFHGRRSICTASRFKGSGPLRALRRRLSDHSTSDDDYMKRLQDAARDPVAFEKFVMAKDEVVDNNDDDEGTKPQGVDDNSAMNPIKKKGYQRIEEWDAQRTKDDMSWEERVQFEGRRFGNQYQQNEILRRNLKSF